MQWENVGGGGGGFQTVTQVCTEFDADYESLKKVVTSFFKSSKYKKVNEFPCTVARLRPL